jgi:hypothetical protein
MSWLPAMMWMRMLNDDELDEYAAINLLQDPEEQESTGCNTGNTPVVDEIRPLVTDDTPTNNNNNNNAEDAPTVAPRAWHHTAMSATTFALSALLAYVATEAICKRIRGRN